MTRPLPQTIDSKKLARPKATALPAGASLSERVMLALEARILDGEFRPGDRLDERDIAAHYDVSRTPVREAVQRLSAAGLVTIRGRSGAVVARMAPADVIDAFIVVAELEALAARQAARRRKPDQLARITNWQDVCRTAAEANDPNAFFEANIGFHEAIAEASGNQALRDQLRAMTIKTSAYRRNVTYRPGRMTESIGEHAAIVAAIETGDADSAADLMRNHVMILGESITDFLHDIQLV